MFLRIVIAFILALLPVYSAELTQEEKILRSEVIYKSGKNYVPLILYKGDILRWNKAYFPIKIYLGNGYGIPNYYYEALKFAVTVWRDETENFFRFEYVENEKDANIVYKILDKSSPDDTLAFTEAVIWGKRLDKQIINVYKKDNFNKYFDPRTITNVMIHEFGHALGIEGHSKDPTSIMYEFYSSKNSKTTPYLNGEDINTIKLLYRIVPDITNGNKNKEKNWITKRVLFF